MSLCSLFIVCESKLPVLSCDVLFIPLIFILLLFLSFPHSHLSSALHFTLQSVVIISFVVALLTAPVNLVVDFLFVEVISAPTIDSMKKEKSHSPTSSSVQTVIRRAAHVVRKMSVVSHEMLNQFTPKRSQSETWSDLISTTTTRVIPPRTKEAHDEAAECVNEVITTAKSRIDSRNTSMKSRYDSYMESHRKPDRDRNRRPTEEVPTSTTTTSILRPSFTSPISSKVKVKSDVEISFQQLTFQINQQRKLLKRSQQDGFDTIWG